MSRKRPQQQPTAATSREDYKIRLDSAKNEPAQARISSDGGDNDNRGDIYDTEDRGEDMNHGNEL